MADIVIPFLLMTFFAGGLAGALYGFLDGFDAGANYVREDLVRRGLGTWNGTTENRTFCFFTEEEVKHGRG